MDQEESFERALADLAIVESAYSEEIQLFENENNTYANDTFPLRFTLKLKENNSVNGEDDVAAHVTLEFVAGYPKETGVQIVSYRSRSPGNKIRLDETVAAIRKTAAECLEEEMEGGLTCCATALEVWNDFHDNNPDAAGHSSSIDGNAGGSSVPQRANYSSANHHYTWITGEPLVDRKSTFQAHVCQVFSEREVKESLQQLIEYNPKLQKATHNMVRLSCFGFFIIVDSF
jgi:hypothetical protein